MRFPNWALIERLFLPYLFWGKRLRGIQQLFKRVWLEPRRLGAKSHQRGINNSLLPCSMILREPDKLVGLKKKKKKDFPNCRKHRAPDHATLCPTGTADGDLGWEAIPEPSWWLGATESV